MRLPRGGLAPMSELFCHAYAKHSKCSEPGCDEPRETACTSFCYRKGECTRGDNYAFAHMAKS
eukprot:6313575-Pyramimonas_sp.AAC.1